MRKLVIFVIIHIIINSYYHYCYYYHYYRLPGLRGELHVLPEAPPK